MTLTQKIEAEMTARGWTAAEKKDWTSELAYGKDAIISPIRRQCPDADRRKALSFPLLAVLPEGAQLRDGDGNVARRDGGYIRSVDGAALANVHGFLTPDMSGERFSDSFEVLS